MDFPLLIGHAWLSAAKATGKKENQQDKQDESKSTATDQRSAEVKSAATEQEHHRCVKAIDRGEFRETFGSSFAISIAGIVALIGLAVAIYLAFL
jgi:cobalamin biosynthesis Mg chelatase CobN